MSDAYKKAGVDIDAGNAFVDRIKGHIRSTHRRGVVSELGGYGGMFAPDLHEMREPILVSGTDGVGTKLKLAIEMGKLDTVGIDLVAMCVNDIICSGAEPLFFLDYFATPKLDLEKHEAIVAGIADGCRQARCALLGGETAEMPDLYAAGDFDLAGFAVGVVDREKIIDGSDIGTGWAIVGLASSGFHSNGYSLVRHIVREKKLDLNIVHDGLEKPLGEMLLAPTTIYTPLVANLSRTFRIRGIAHITGGGFWDNIPRILPAGVTAVIDRQSWIIPPLIRFIQHQGNVTEDELLRVFNCGIGMVLVVPSDEADDLAQTATTHGVHAYRIGQTRRRKKDEPSVVIA